MDGALTTYYVPYAILGHRITLSNGGCQAVVGSSFLVPTDARIGVFGTVFAKAKQSITAAPSIVRGRAIWVKDAVQCVGIWLARLP